MSKKKTKVYLDNSIDYKSAVCYICGKHFEKWETYQIIGLDEEGNKIVRHKNHKKLLLKLAKAKLIGR